MSIDADRPRPGHMGDRTRRKEDPRLLTGGGRYLGDVAVPGLLDVAIRRSAEPHAVLQEVDVTAARACPGVVDVVTQADLDAMGAARMRHHLTMPGVQPLTWGVLADGRVRFQGDPIAAVVADTRARAEDAAAAIRLRTEALPPLVDPAAALAPGAEPLYEGWSSNALLELSFATPGLAEALAAAPRTRTERITSHRIAAVPLEGHGALAQVDPVSGVLTVWASNQQPHQLRTVIAEVVGLRESDVRVIVPDMGGGFGNKQHFTREECLVALLALRTGRPVRWLQDRFEYLTAGIHSREQAHDVTVGYDDDGRLLAWHSRIVSTIGNPELYFSGVAPSLVTVGALTGAYVVGEVGFDLTCVATTTSPIGAYRGFGQPQAHLVTERLLDLVAADVGVDPLEVRRRNVVADDTERPVVAPNGSRLDMGPMQSQIDVLAATFDATGWRARQEAARAEGRYLGIGYSTLLQGAAPTQHGVAGRFGSYESATVAVLPDGTVDVAVGTTSQGQSHDTVFAQVAADVLDVDVDDVSVRWGDTADLPYGMGTWGSRSTVMGGGAVHLAAREVRDKVEKVAAALGTDPSTAEVADLAWFHPHRLPAGFGPGLSASVCYTPGNTRPEPTEEGGTNFDETFGSFMTAVVVEVEAATGRVEVLDVVMVADCGRVINPTAVEGQIQGGFAQGLGNVLLEEVLHGADGTVLTSDLLSYRLPEAGDVPVVRVVHRSTPSEVVGGFRGVGEAGITAAPAAIAGAVADALAPLGVEIRSTRLQAHHLRAALAATGRQPDPAAFARA